LVGCPETIYALQDYEPVEENGWLIGILLSKAIDDGCFERVGIAIVHETHLPGRDSGDLWGGLWGKDRDAPALMRIINGTLGIC
jgi:hypothetical protein